ALDDAGKVAFLLLAPPAILAGLFADRALGVWLGQDFASHAVEIVRLLVVAVFLNGLAQVPSAYLQAIGRPDLTTKLLALQVAPYLAAVTVLAGTYGAVGAAAACALRSGVDLLLLLGAANRLSPPVSGQRLPAAIALVALVLAALIPVHWPVPVLLVAALILLAGFAGTCWLFLLRDDERTRLAARIRHRLAR
ncbi:MAG: polysaccharide biosynthesis C-terminal domain-containing protein, partial [Rhodospirillales bacterium]|nr:polysaccharide biosynthesis C-terminal domain-containing protein [Rhodospirillales bacterium]